jgi:hypothetical protein
VRSVRVLVAVALLASLTATTRTPIKAASSPYTELVGALHNHSGYSDGWPGTTPTTYFERARDVEHLDFFGSGEHSDNADVPVTFSEGCVGEALPGCVGTDAGSLDKWDATLQQARAATTDTYTAFRGFEWTSDRFGHINVYLSQHDTNAKIDGGYATMETFYEWFTRSPQLGGGADGLATFNHPGAKKLTDEPAVNWNDFAQPENFAAVDARMVGIEVYNDDGEFGTSQGPPGGYYVHALDKGWHVGAVGAEDLHGIPGSRDDYGGTRWAKTVVLATDRSERSIRDALLARRFYAIRRNVASRLQLGFTIDGKPMGSRLTRPSGGVLEIAATTNRPDATVEVVTSRGVVVASSANGSVVANVPATTAQKYYFMRVREGAEQTGYSSPIWVTATTTAPPGTWLAGDLHVHTCFSHDAYCGPSDDNTGPDEFYTLSGSVDERFLEAKLRGLDYLAITDHNDVRSVTAPGFGSRGVIGVPGYENSIRGHAQMLGATSLLDNGDASAAAINEMIAPFRASGGIFQANHPADGLTYRLDPNCTNMSGLHWQYGFDVPVDAVEVWNISHLLQPVYTSAGSLPAGTSNEDAGIYLECWLNRGAKVAATGGSDSHWLSTALAQGPGNPTTWVYSSERSASSVLDGIRDGRTSVTMLPPVLGGPRLLLEADADRNGTYESMIGDTVPPGTPMRVRAEGLLGTGLAEVRANGATLFEGKGFLPGRSVNFVAPSKPGWVRAILRGPDPRAVRIAACEPVLGSFTTYCRNRIVVLALTSAIYLR